MASALQQQLAAIAEKSTNQLDLKAQRNQHSQSLLFDPKEAANQTFDTIYQVALDGFEDLCMLDARFTSYAHNLFSEQSKSEDRTQMTAAENEELDKVIHNFLGLVSGRLLLSPGQKTVEWLVRRFRIHEYNTEYFILAFLPYHDKNIFPTALSILPKSRALSPALKFLQPYIKSLSTLPRHAVVYSAINNPSFFALLNRFALSTAKQGNQSASLLGFWASILAQAINGQLDAAQSGRPDIKRQREEEVLLRVIPVLQEASQISDVTELFLGCCMIAVILATKIDLKDDVLDALMDTISGSWTKQTFNDGIACLSVIAQEKSTVDLPKATARKLLNTTQIFEKLEACSKRYPVDRLSTGIAATFVKGRRPKGTGNHSQLLVDYFSMSAVSENNKADILQAAIEGSSQERDGHPIQIRDVISGITSVVQRSASQSLIATCIRQKRFTSSSLEKVTGSPLQLDLSEVTEDNHEVDEEMRDQDTLEAPEAAKVDIEALASKFKATHSFLVPEAQTAYSNLSRVFAQCISQKGDLDALTEKTKSISGHDTVPFLSLLVKIWTVHPSALVRRAALQVAKSIVSATETQGDHQFVLPYVLCALQDDQETIRRSAAELVLELKSSLKSADKAKALANLTAMGKDDLYGPKTKAVKWMKPTDYYTVLTEAIIGAMEECVVDVDAIRRILAAAIDGSDDDIELKTSVRASLYANLLSHAITTPVLRARVKLFDTLSIVGKSASAAKKNLFVPALKTWIATSNAERTEICRIANVDRTMVDKAYMDLITGESEEEVDLLRSIIQGETDCSSDMCFLVTKRLRAIWSDLRDRDQTNLAEVFLNASLEDHADDSASDPSSNALTLLRQVRLSGDALVALMQGVHASLSMPDTAPATKRRRTSSSRSRGQDVNTEDMTKMIRRLTVVLELVESSKPERHPELLKYLFHALGDLQQVKSQLGSDLVYLQQMILGSLLAMVNTLKGTPASRMDRSALRTDLVVDSMRSTSSTQVHNSALLLIAALASWAPELVLHSVMPLFTFMSSSILRQGDDYSAHVIDQTVSQVIPPLVSSLRKKNQDLVTGAAELLLSFTAAFEHMPMHRRLQLFKQLITALGPEEALSAIIAMLFEKYPSDRRIPSFCAELASQYPPVTQIRAVVQYIDLVADALQPKRTVSEAIFSFDQTTDELVQDKAVLLISSLSSFLNEGQLQHQVRSALTRNKDDMIAIEQIAGAMIDRSVGFAKGMSAKGDLRSASNAVVTSALNLLPTAHFARAAVPLLDTPDESLGVRILDTLEARTNEVKTSDVNARVVLLETLPVICKLAESSASQVIQHGAIACVDRIVEKFGKKDTATSLEAARTLASSSILGHASASIQAIALFALATMVEVLRDDIIGVLPTVIDHALLHLQQAVTTKPDPKLCDASLAFLTTALEYLPWTISKDSMGRIIRSSIDAAAHPDIAIPTRAARETFINLAAESVDLKVLAGAIEVSLEKGFERGADGTEEILNIIDKVVTSATKSSMSKHHNAILSILKQTFDLRAGLSAASEEESLDDEELDDLDKRRDAIMMRTIMKLNDATFRPFFASLVEWATEDSDEEAQIDRQLSLYTFLATFFDTLKSLVTSYSSFILDHTATALTSLSVANRTDRPLLAKITAALTATFTHDQDDFWAAPSHFGKIYPALVAQLQKSRSIAKEDSISIIPTIVELASAASSQDHLKELNSELLKMMRSREAHVRLAAVKTERALTERLGEDWLALLPEMLPFIGEVQEDEDEGVEREVLAWIKGIEGVLGESLEGMLQ
ncbi:armadillo-type protein [Elsinoe ampelina]|uniref:U3 small nucleolar RNA-associated protein 10 n=1 Tax=Elsinoe ampelina TaxID=302913 RepID=A0A6A6G9T6_9PEZI|nr:armadillo-type protein [Elsinoe ampelina]